MLFWAENIVDGIALAGGVGLSRRLTRNALARLRCAALIDQAGRAQARSHQR